MSGIVHLVRHGTHGEVGRVLSGRSEIALSPQGRAEAEALVQAFAGVPIGSLHASPRRRARETIAPLARARGLEVRISPALDEIDFGAFAGERFDALDDDPAWHRWNSERDIARCPGGETMGEAVARALAYLGRLSPAALPAVCVSHCDIIRGVVADRLGLGFRKMFALDCDPGSVTTIAFEEGGARVVTLNRRVR